MATIIMNYPGLRLPDGRIAESLDRFDLGRTLAALGVAGVDVGTPKFKALLAYSEHVETMKAQPARAYSPGDEFIKAVVADQEVKAV
jgi:hypothetical protein